MRLHNVKHLLLALICVSGLTFAVGCEREVLDIDTPGGGVEVNKNPVTDETSVDVKDHDDGPLD